MAKKSDINPLDILAALGDLSAASKPKTKAKSSGKEEMVDVVDEKDVVIDTKPRSEVQGNNLRHRVSHVFLENDAGEMVVQWRALTKTYAPRTFTASVAGTVSAGDDYLTTAVREAEEEMGLTGLTLTKVGVAISKNEFPANIGIFAAPLNGEIVDFWSPEEAEFMLVRFPYLLAPNFQVSLKKYLTWRKKHER
jgi:8-oxo-dGTP pyrophosphatase MutT (NUDIX family)